MIAEALTPRPETIETPDAPVRESPYKFLDYFTDTEQDRRRFGGRDREIREIVARITNERTLVLYGPSGMGKTSLLLAGIFPALRERGYRPVHVRTLTAPLADLLREVATLSPGEAQKGEGLGELLARATHEGPVALVLDQLEELFIRFRKQPEERAALEDALAGVVNDRSLDVSVVFSLREDYLASLDEFSRALPDVLKDRYRLQSLTAFGVRQSITRPLVDAGVPFEPAVVSRLISQIEDVDFEPPLLQIMCTELFREAARRTGTATPRLTVADLERLGGRNGIFRRYLDGVTRELPAEKHLLARMILDALITSEGTKRAATLAEILLSGFQAREDEVREVLDTLVDQRLLRREERNGDTWFELIHERLVPVIQEWLESDREFFEFRQARIYVRNNSQNDLWRRRSDTLLSTGVLANLLGPYRERFRFSERELELVVRSSIYRHSEEVSFWAESLGPDNAKAFLFEFLASPLERERLAAAGSARYLEDGDGRLAAACLHVALEDPDEAVRRESGLSLARLAGQPEIEALRAAYRNRGQRERVREALAAMRAGGNTLAKFGWRDRWTARRREESRLLSDRNAALRRRWRAGAAAGACAGVLVWAAETGIPELADWLRGPATYRPLFQEWSDVLSSLGYLGLLSLLGALIGWSASLAAARHAALRGEGRWLTGFFRSPLFLTFWTLLFLLVGCSLTDSASMAGWKIAGTITFWLLLGLGILVWAHWSRPLVWPGISRSGAWLGSLLASAGIPVLGLLIAITAIRKSLDPYFLTGSISDSATGMVEASFMVLIAMARSAARQPLAEVPPASPGRRGWRLAVTVLAVVLVPVWLGHFYGFETLLPEVIDYQPGRGVSRSWKPAPEDNRVDPPPFELRNATGEPQVVEVEREVNPVKGLAAVALGWDDREIQNKETLSLPVGRFPGHFTLHFPPKEKPLTAGANRGGSLRLRDKRRSDPPSLNVDRMNFWGSLTLEPVSGEPGHWRIPLRGRVDESLLTALQSLGYSVQVTAWCEALKPRQGTTLRVRALQEGQLLKPNDAPPRTVTLDSSLQAVTFPALEILPGQEVAVPLGRDLGLGLLSGNQDGVSWFVRPDKKGAWSLEIRLREVGKAGAGRISSQEPRMGEVFVMWQPVFPK